MSITVLLADDSRIMREALRKTLAEERRIAVVAEAETFADALTKIAKHAPDVLLLDLSMPANERCSASYVKAQLEAVPCILAISFSNDEDAATLAENYGVTALLDKMKLYDQMIPMIVKCGGGSELARAVGAA